MGLLNTVCKRTNNVTVNKGFHIRTGVVKFHEFFALKYFKKYVIKCKQIMMFVN